MRGKLKIKNEKLKIKRLVSWTCFLFLVACCLLLALWWRQGWNGKEPVNVVVSAGDRFWVLAVRPDEKMLVEVEIPPNVVVPVGEAQWQVRSLWELSQLEGSLEKTEAVGWELLAVPVDMIARLEEWRGNQTRYQFKLFSFYNSSEMIRLVRFIRSLHEGQVTKVNLAELSVARRVVDPGGTELIEIDPELLSPLVAEWFQIGQLRQEGLSAAIRNTTGVVGAGNKLAQQLEHMGLRIVKVEKGEEKPRLLVKDKQLLDSLTVKKLTDWLELEAEVSQFDQRADILVIQ